MEKPPTLRFTTADLSETRYRVKINLRRGEVCPPIPERLQGPLREQRLYALDLLMQELVRRKDFSAFRKIVLVPVDQVGEEYAEYIGVLRTGEALEWGLHILRRCQLGIVPESVKAHEKEIEEALNQNLTLANGLT